MNEIIKQIVLKHQLDNTYVQLSGWTIMRLYVSIRKLLVDNDLYHTNDLFNIIFDNKKIIVCDLEFNVLSSNINIEN